MTQVNRRNPRNRLSRREWLQKVSAGGICIAFADGHVETVNKSVADKILSELYAGLNPPRPEKLR